MNIFLKDTDNFENNGLGFLKDLISAKVTECLNGEYTLNIEYPIGSRLSEYLIEENILKSKVEDGSYQLFRINYVEKNFKTIKAQARHIFYDLLNNFIEDTAPSNLVCGEFCNWILSKTNYNHKFTSTSDISLSKSARYVRRNPIEAIMGDIDNSIINLFGAELERDNFNIKLLKQRGNNNGIKLSFGKNITGIQITIDISSTYTKVMPLGYDALMLPEKYVESDLINEYQSPKICKVEFSDIKYDPEDENAFHDIEDAYNALRNVTKELFKSGLDKPIINIKVNWLELSKTKEYYERYYNLERVKLGDTIVSDILGVSFETRVIKTIYNVLTDMIETFEIGTFKASVQNTLNNINRNVEKVNPTSILDLAKQNATSLINSAMGGYIIKTQTDLFIMDAPTKETATKIWRWNLNGLAYSKNGIDGPYETAITSDGKIVADFITTGKLDTNVIEGYNDLLLKVSNIADLTKTISSKQKLIVDSAITGPVIAFSISGNMSLLYPSNDIIPSEDLFPLDSYLIIENDSGKKKIHLPLIYLNKIDSTCYDEFIISKSETKIIRRVGVDSDNNLIPLAEEKIETLEKVQLDLEEGTSKIWLESFYDQDIDYKIKYALKTEFSDVYATIAQLDSSISQASGRITAEVNGKIDSYNEDINAKLELKIDIKNLASEISGTADIIRFKTGKFTIEGDNCSIDENGVATFKGAIIDGGEIRLKNNAVIVGDNGLLTNLQYQSYGQYMGKSLVGFIYDSFTTGEIKKTCLPLIVKIPENFTIVHAYVSIDHSRVNFMNSALNESYIGVAKNIRLYKANNTNTLAIKSDEYATSGYMDYGLLSGNEIIGAFGDNGYTANNIYSDSNEVVKSNDIGSSLSTGNNILFIATADSTTSTTSNMKDANSKTGAIQITVDVIGYTNFN